MSFNRTVVIDDNEVAHLRVLLNEIFGDENFIAQIVWQRSKKGDSKLVAVVHEYILVYARDRTAIVAAGGWRRPKHGASEVLEHYEALRQELKLNHTAIREQLRAWYKSLSKDDPRRAHEHYSWSDERGLYFADNFAGPDDGRKSRPRYDILHPRTKKPCKKPSTGWRWDEERTKAALADRPPRIHFGPDESTIPCRKSYLSEVQSEPFSSVFYRDGRAATLEVEDFVGKGVFPFPKNADVLAELIELSTADNDIVLDFFAGSGTSAQAVLEQNRKDGTNRRFLSVQLQEPVAIDSKAGEAGFASIADIAKERLRRAIKKLKQEKRPGPHEDLGFRVLRLARSHYRAWTDYVGDDIEDAVDLFAQAEEVLVDGWTPEGLLTEVMLLEGFPLDSRIESLGHFKKNKVRQVTSECCAHKLVVCTDKKVYADTLSALALGDTDILVCIDRALTDEAKVRLSDHCILKTI